MAEYQYSGANGGGVPAPVVAIQGTRPMIGWEGCERWSPLATPRTLDVPTMADGTRYTRGASGASVNVGGPELPGSGHVSAVWAIR